MTHKKVRRLDTTYPSCTLRIFCVNVSRTIRFLCSSKIMVKSCETLTCLEFWEVAEWRGSGDVQDGAEVLWLAYQGPHDNEGSLGGSVVYKARQSTRWRPWRIQYLEKGEGSPPIRRRSKNTYKKIRIKAKNLEKKYFENGKKRAKDDNHQSLIILIYSPFCWIFYCWITTLQISLWLKTNLYSMLMTELTWMVSIA